MDKGISFRQYESGDDENILELLKRTFPKWGIGEDRLEHWRWKYLETPLGSNISVALDDDRVVGVMHQLLLKIKIGDSVQLCHYSDDTAVDKEYRDAGVYRRLKDLTLQKRGEIGVSFYYYATQNPAIVKVSSRRGDQLFPHSLGHMIRVVDVNAVLKQRNRDSLVNALQLGMLQKIGRLREALSQKTGEAPDVEVEEVPGFDDGINLFWGEISGHYDYIIEKKREYLNWRHSESSRDTSIRLATSDGGVVGYSVLRRSVGEYSEGYITDLMVVPNRLDVASRLMLDALEYFGDKVISVHYTPTKGHPYQRVAEDHGLVDVSRENKNYFYYGLVGDGGKDDFEKMPPSRVCLQYY